MFAEVNSCNARVEVMKSASGMAVHRRFYCIWKTFARRRWIMLRQPAAGGMTLHQWSAWLISMIFSHGVVGHYIKRMFRYLDILACAALQWADHGHCISFGVVRS